MTTTVEGNEYQQWAEAGLDWPDEDLELDAPERKGFIIHSDSEANHVLARLARWEREAARVQGIVDDELERIAVFKAANLGTKDDPRGAAREAEFYRGVLVDYYRRLEDADPDLAQTRKLPGGTIGRRKNPDSLEVTDEAAFIRWAIANDRGDLLKPFELASKTTVRDALTPQADPKSVDHGSVLHFVDADGAVIPGVMYRVGDDRYEAKAQPTERP